MTWAEFKEIVERQGVKDEMEILSIDLHGGSTVVSFTRNDAVMIRGQATIKREEGLVIPLTAFGIPPSGYGERDL
jgi:hypothetical protein